MKYLNGLVVSFGLIGSILLMGGNLIGLGFLSVTIILTPKCLAQWEKDVILGHKKE